MYPSARLLVIAATALWTPPLLAAGKSEKADRVVEAVLQQEARGDVTRRADDLGGAIEQSNRARWAAGYVRLENEWQKYDVRLPVTELIQQYEGRRGDGPLNQQQHLELANWCSDHDLRDQERAHLWAVLADEWNQPAIWRRLGFQLVDGEWTTRENQRRLEQSKLQAEKDSRRWSPTARELSKRFNNPSAAVQSSAMADLAELTDAAALNALEQQLASATEKSAQSFVKWASQQQRVEATLSLVRQAINSQWESVRTMAADRLAERRFDHVMPPLLLSLSTPYTLTLSDVNRPSAAIPFEAVAVLRRESWNMIQRHMLVMQLGRSPVILVGVRTGRVTTIGDSITELERNDFDRRKSDQRRRIEGDMALANHTIEVTNSRAGGVLAKITGLPQSTSPEDWWESWLMMTSTEVVGPKKVVEVVETETGQPPPRIIYTTSCLPAGTLIDTSSGLRAIESLRIADTLLAKDIETGELSYKPIIRTTVRKPQPLLTVHTRDDSIRATRGHYFWVSGKGWRMTKEIQPGDRLHGVEGTVAVTDVSLGGNEAVYNLVVEGANTYFVGTSHVLSHDVTPPVPTDIVVPGLAVR